MSISTMVFFSSLVALPCFASGVSGGGGNVMFPVDPKDPAPVTEVLTKIAKARSTLPAYFQDKQDRFQRGDLSDDDTAIFAPLFSAGKDLVKVARETGVDVEQRHPCFDSQATPVDGSIFSDRKGSICVSSLTISKRVERKDVPAQSAALLAHEFTEVLGFTEEDAVRVQSKVLEDFRRNSN